ncbi:hypothetical protein GF324_07780, partial [bacterium]|nr:hypothetical protein [bacterium]
MPVESRFRPSNKVSRERHYRELLRHTLLRFGLLYYLPLLLLAAFFHLQTIRLLHDSRDRHLSALAEQQAATLDLFLSERLINLSNAINAPDYPDRPDNTFLSQRLQRLQKTSNTFVDLGLLDAEGNLFAYTGPFPHLEERNYAREEW